MPNVSSTGKIAVGSGTRFAPGASSPEYIELGPVGASNGASPAASAGCGSPATSGTAAGRRTTSAEAVLQNVLEAVRPPAEPPLAPEVTLHAGASGPASSGPADGDPGSSATSYLMKALNSVIVPCRQGRHNAGRDLDAEVQRWCAALDDAMAACGDDDARHDCAAKAVGAWLISPRLLERISTAGQIGLADRLSRYSDVPACRDALGRVATAVRNKGSHGEYSAKQLARLLKAFSACPAEPRCRQTVQDLIRARSMDFVRACAWCDLAAKADSSESKQVLPSEKLLRDSLSPTAANVVDADTGDLVAIMAALRAWPGENPTLDMALVTARLIALRKGDREPAPRHMADVLDLLRKWRDFPDCTPEQRMRISSVAPAVASAIERRGAGSNADATSLAGILDALSAWPEALRVQNAVLKIANDIFRQDFKPVPAQKELWSLVCALSRWPADPALNRAALKLIAMAGPPDAAANTDIGSLAHYLMALARLPAHDAVRNAAVDVAHAVGRLPQGHVADEAPLLAILAALGKWHDDPAITLAVRRIAGLVPQCQGNKLFTVNFMSRLFDALSKWRDDPAVMQAAAHVADTFNWRGIVGNVQARDISVLMNALADWPTQPFARETARMLAELILRAGISATQAQRRQHAEMPAQEQADALEDASTPLRALKNLPDRSTIAQAMRLHEYTPLLMLENALEKWPDDETMQRAARYVDEFIEQQMRLESGERTQPLPGSHAGATDGRPAARITWEHESLRATGLPA